jgi:hypothetical protein
MKNITGIEQEKRKQAQRYREKAAMCGRCKRASFTWKKRASGRMAKENFRCAFGNFKISTRGLCIEFVEGEPFERERRPYEHSPK